MSIGKRLELDGFMPLPALRCKVPFNLTNMSYCGDKKIKAWSVLKEFTV